MHRLFLWLLKGLLAFTLAFSNLDVLINEYDFIWRIIFMIRKILLTLTFVMSLLTSSSQACLGPVGKKVIKTVKVTAVTALVVYGITAGYGPDFLTELSDEHGGQVVKEAMEYAAFCSREKLLELAEEGREMAVEFAWYVGTGEAVSDIVDGAYFLLDCAANCFDRGWRVWQMMPNAAPRLRGS